MFYFKNNNVHDGIEFVDNMWLHFHSSIGLISFKFSYIQIRDLIAVLQRAHTCTSDSDLDRSFSVGPYTYDFEGPDEDGFNIMIWTRHSMISFRIDRSEIPSLIEELNNTRFASHE